jgi:hypothetical protein
MPTPRVFIPQIIKRFDRDTRRLVEMYDFTPAQQFGQLEVVLDDGDDPNLISRMTHKVRSRLATFTHEDYLIAVGDPCLIATCAGVILRRSPTLKMLKWVRELKTYIQTEIDLS